jgi:hypothetical protein
MAHHLRVAVTVVATVAATVAATVVATVAATVAASASLQSAMVVLLLTVKLPNHGARHHRYAQVLGRWELLMP